MISEKLNEEMNKQLNAELYSSYLYLSMAAWLARKGLPGFEHWMKGQAQEELEHALKFFDYINERGGKVEMTAIAAPEQNWESPLHVFEGICAHEAHVTNLINKLMACAIEEKDYAAQGFLQWFVAEQVEEESSVGDIKNKLELIGNAHNGLFMLDRELSNRVVTSPADSESE
jgi:ferritin